MKKYIEKTCEDCGGTGSLNDDYIICFSCGGAGVIFIPRWWLKINRTLRRLVKGENILRLLAIASLLKYLFSL